MRRSSRTAAALTVSLLAVVTALASCGSDGSARSGDPDLVVEVEITSEEQRLSRVGPDERVVYGWNRLGGSGTAEGATGPVEVEMLGNVSYEGGDGPFFGFITFVFEDGASLAVRMDGAADASADTSDATFEAELEVLGGTGRLVAATGSGTFVGRRTAELGGAVDSTFSLWLDGA